MKFCEHLIATGIIPKSALDEALDVHKVHPKKIGRILRDLGYLSQSDLNRQLCLFLQPPDLRSVDQFHEKKTTISKGFRQWCDDRSVIPLFESDLRSAIIAPGFRDELLEELETNNRNQNFECYLATRDIFFYLKSIVDEEDRQDSQVEPHRKHIEIVHPYTRLFRDCVFAAKEMNASDIHIQPTESGIDVRFRVYGDLKLWKRLGIEHRQSFVNEAKRLTGVQIAVSGKPQDGSCLFPDWNLKIRTSLLPTNYGEKIVLRLLDLERTFDLSQQGFEPTELQDLRKALELKDGVIVISGPTGSGKTSTLYSLLCAIDREKKNVITLEDPIEYSIPGLTQVEVSPKMSFADALRAVLRQDPDVILVGEIRDPETADLCAKAAATGHLVLSTLHANGAIEAVSRLQNLGIEPYLLKTCFRFSAAQRLVKQVCPNCSRPAPPEICSHYGRAADLRLRIHNPTGCSSCVDGVIGRIPLIEYLTPPALSAYFDGKVKEDSFLSLKKRALNLATRGKVDAKEVLQVA